jgi:hypothetical protein
MNEIATEAKPATLVGTRHSLDLPVDRHGFRRALGH